MEMSMEANENEKETVREASAEAETEQDTLSEAEKQEILSVFSETNENKRRRTGFRFTIRNQLILLGGVLALAVVLLGVYFVFFRPEEPLPSFYVLDEQTETVLETLEQKVTVTFCNREKGDANAESNADFYRIYTYATLYESKSGRVKLSFDASDTFNGVRIACNGKTMEIPYADFYCQRKIDGATYAFDGERLLTGAIAALNGKQTPELPVRALEGYDRDGNEVLASGGVVMFPMVARENIAFLEVENPSGSYSVYRNNSGDFSFTDCEMLTYDAELFASLLVDCRYVVTAGKLEDRMDLSVYGLDKKESLTCSYMLLTQPDRNGEFFFHQVWVGKKASSGSYYYALYFGGKMDKNHQIVEKYPNQNVFLLPYATVENNLCQPVETFFDAKLTDGVSKVEELYTVDQICLEYFYDDETRSDISMKVANLPVFSFSDNVASNSNNASELLTDKKSFVDSGLPYTDWTGEADSKYLLGLASSDKKPFSVKASVTKIATDGMYECRFALAKDLDNAKYPALMPEEIGIRYTSDGINYTKVSDHGLDFSAQKEDTVQEYVFRIQTDQPILQIEMTFTMPDAIGYLVMDDLRIYANGEDAVPNDALTGYWRLLSPSEFIPDGKTYAYLDSTNFTDLLQGIVTLKGDSVAKVGISKRGENKTSDIIDEEALKEFGLDQPAMHFSYLLKDYVTDVYISAYDEENGCYYAYSTVTGDVYGNGNDVTICTGLIARVLPSSAAWLTMDPLDLVDHALVGMFVYEIEQMDVTYNGQTYTFDVTTDGKTLTSVRLGDTELNERYFRYLYLSIVRLNMKDAYVAQPSDQPSEYLRIRIKTTSDEKEFVFYRVSSSRAYYTVNGDEAKYYCLFSSLRNVTDKLERFVAGDVVER